MTREDEQQIALHVGIVIGIVIEKSENPLLMKAFMDGLIRGTRAKFCSDCWESRVPCYCMRCD